MKKHYILTAAVALTLCACGGGNSNQNNASQTADTTNVASQENGDDKTQMIIQIMKELGVDDDFDPETINSTTEEAAKTLGVNSDYFRCVEEFDNHYKTVYNIFFYPLNSGGTEIIVELKTVGLDDDMYYQITDERHYCRQTFENGSLTKHDEVFPLTINDFYSNADKFPEPSRMALEEAVSKKLKVKFLDNNKIEVTLNPYETECICEGEYELMLPSTLCGLADKTKNIFPSVTMSWNGEKFVRESKPFEEDLKYFDNVKIPTGIIVDIWKLANNFDPKSTNDQNRIVGLVVNNTVIYEYFDGDEYSRMAQQYACYPLKSGGYLVLINVEQTDNYGVDVFKYDNGKN